MEKDFLIYIYIFLFSALVCAVLRTAPCEFVYVSAGRRGDNQHDGKLKKKKRKISGTAERIPVSSSAASTFASGLQSKALKIEVCL